MSQSITLIELNTALAPILVALGVLVEKVTGLEEKVTGLEEKVTGLEEKVTSAEEKVGVLVEKVTGLEEKVTSAEEKVTGLAVRFVISDAKANNAQIGRSETLLRVPLSDGSYPMISADIPVEYPTTISHLLVAGNETLPDGGRNNWNKYKSLALLAAFGDASDNDTDREDGPTSRRRRLKVAKHLGVTKTQLNFCQITL